MWRKRLVPSISLPSFLLGAASGAVIAYLLLREPSGKGEWQLPRFHQGHPIPSKEEILEKFRADISVESYEEVKEAWKKLCM
jgi:hypothetical protein